MSMELRSGDILAADTDAVVNTVNCVGIMGRGIALQFKKAYPANFKAYEAACRRKEVEPGRMFVYETGQLTPPRFVINFPTKRHWKGKSRMSDIEAGLTALVAEIHRLGITSIAIPPLGAGLGGLNWPDVRERIALALAEVPGVRALVYEPAGAPPSEDMVKSDKVPSMTAGRAALVGLMERYLGGLLDPFITLLEVHKLMYFLQEAGPRKDLGYVKGTYGPYSEKLRHVLSGIEGYYISGYADGGDAPNKPLELIPGAVNDAAAVLEHHPDTLARFDRVVALVEGFETPYGLELLSTVHWVATHEGATTPEAATARTYAWNERKRGFTRDQIQLAWEVLRAKGWLPEFSATVSTAQMGAAEAV